MTSYYLPLALGFGLLSNGLVLLVMLGSRTFRERTSKTARLYYVAIASADIGCVLAVPLPWFSGVPASCFHVHCSLFIGLDTVMVCRRRLVHHHEWGRLLLHGPAVNRMVPRLASALPLQRRNARLDAGAVQRRASRGAAVAVLRERLHHTRPRARRARRALSRLRSVRSSRHSGLSDHPNKGILFRIPVTNFFYSIRLFAEEMFSPACDYDCIACVGE